MSSIELLIVRTTINHITNNSLICLFNVTESNLFEDTFSSESSLVVKRFQDTSYDMQVHITCSKQNERTINRDCIRIDRLSRSNSCRSTEFLDEGSFVDFVDSFVRCHRLVCICLQCFSENTDGVTFSKRNIFTSNEFNVVCVQDLESLDSIRSSKTCVLHPDIDITIDEVE